jgi:hypothetical protein
MTNRPPWPLERTNHPLSPVHNSALQVLAVRHSLTAADGYCHIIGRGENIIDTQGKLWFGAGIAIIIVGIFAFSGVLEIVFAVSGVLIASQGRKRRA